jgi:hypothetical protein
VQGIPAQFSNGHYREFLVYPLLGCALPRRMTQFPNDEQQLQPKAMATRILGLKKRHGWRNLDQKLQALRLDTAEFLVGASIRSEASISTTD